MTAVFRHFLMAAGILALALTDFSAAASAQGMSFEKGRLTLITQSGPYKFYAGLRSDPPISLPSAIGSIPQARATAPPPHCSTTSHC